MNTQDTVFTPELHCRATLSQVSYVNNVEEIIIKVNP